MTLSLSPQQQLKAFINTAQYLAGLASGEDIWQEAGKLLVRFFGADVAAFGERSSDGGIGIGHRASSERGREAWLPEAEIIAAMGDVFESGFLTFLSYPAAEPVAAGFFPILHENRVIAVMLVGHLSADPLAKESLDLYLAAAGLIGATYSRRISETAVLKAKEELEQRVVERTAELDAMNEELAATNDELELSWQETKRTEEAMREREERFRTLANTIPQLCWMANADGWIFWYNRRWYEYTGTTPEQMEGWGWQSVHDPDSLPHVLEQWQASISTGKPFYMVFPLRGSDGVFRPFLTQVKPVYGQDGKIVNWCGTNTDITEQVKREKETLQESEERFRLLIDATKDYAIIMLDADGRVVSWNEGAKRLKGWDEQEILGRHFSLFYTEEAVASGHPEHELKIAATEGQYAEEVWLVRKNGSRFMADVIITAIRGESGKLRGFAKITRDITERKQAEERLQATLMDLERSNKELEQFAYVASHDLQEPLRMVSSYTQLLAQRYEGQLDDKAKKYIDYAVDGAVRMQRLINDLLAFSRISTQGKTIEKIDSHSVLGEAIHNLAAAIEENRAMVTNDDLPTVRADATQLCLLFQNLIGNAIKYRGADLPHIHVSACELGREWRFSVMDNGIGIDAQYAEKVFVLFKRLHTKQEYPGTGIGLAMCKRIVERHGGRIWFESAIGKGSTFYFTLPK